MKNCKTFLDEYNISNVAIAVAVSGGADSIALLYTLNALRDEYALKLSVVHVNYNLRGDESLKECAYVKSCAESLNMPFYYNEVNGLTLSDTGLEEQARIIRYDFFDEIRESYDIDYVAIAHTQNDQAETLLFRLSRGTGVRGAAAMSPIRDGFYIRPLLSCSRSEIEQWLKEQAIEWCEDSSNRDTLYSRNAIRHKVVPKLTEINSEAISHLNQFASRMGRLQNSLEKAFEEWFYENRLFESENSLLMKTASSPFLQEFIPLLLHRRGITVTASHVESLEHFWQRRSKELLLSQESHALMLGDKMVIKKRISDEFSFEEKAVSGDTIQLSPLFSVDVAFLSMEVKSIRMVSEKDVILIQGVEKSIMGLLKKRQVPLWLRERWPVYLNKSSVIIGLFR